MGNNFAWIGTWAITNRCNLSCAYCEPKRLSPSAQEPVDYEKAVERIGRIGPKVLNISGGEPTLVDRLPDILRRIKGEWNPFIRIVNNGTRMKDLVKCLPSFDRLVVSLDGLGEVNKQTRGIDGHRVLEEIRKFRTEASQDAGALPEIVVNQVVTVHNAKEIGDLCKAVAGVDPKIEIALSALIPNDHPLSISRHPKVWDEFWEDYRNLRAEGYALWEHFGHFKTQEPVKCLECYNQFFVIRFRPDGIPVTCTPDLAMTTRHCTGYFREILSKPRLIPKAAGSLVRLAKGLGSRKPDFKCLTPCNCESWIDFLITGREDVGLDYYFRPLFGRFTKEEIEKVVTWVHEYVNPDFQAKRLDPLIGD